MRPGTYIKGIAIMLLLLPALASASVQVLQHAIDDLYQGKSREGYEKLLPLAQAGNLDAQVMVGIIYSEGRGVRYDRKRSRIWFKRAAYKGRVDAAYLLGLSYLHKNSTDKEYEQAVYWVKYAARRDNRPAQRFMALAYEKGWMNVEVNTKNANYWWNRYNHFKLATNSH